MRHSNITATRLIGNQLVLDTDISLLTMAKTISKKISVKVSAAKPFGKPPTGDITFGIESDIRLYAIEDGYETEKEEESGILDSYDSILTASKQNLIKMQSPYINTFYHEGSVVIIAMYNLTVNLFEHLDITYPMDVNKRIAYIQRILRETAIKKYQEVMVTCTQLLKELAGDECTLRDMTALTAEYFWTWAKMDTTGYVGHPYLSIDKCVDFERKLWFKLGKCMWRKNRSVYQDHIKYGHNDIMKPFKVKMLRYAKRVREMHDLAKYLPQPSMKGESDMVDNWIFQNKEFTTSDI